MNKLNRILLLNNFKIFNKTYLNKKSFSTGKEINGLETKNANFLQTLGFLKNSGVKRGKPETFVGDLQEVLKLAPRNVNAFFFSWSITCRVATALLCMLLL